MREEKRPSVPIAEDMRFQERAWITQRIGWTVLALLVALALLGVFANGVLSAASVASPDGLVRVEYERFAHRTAQSHFSVHVAGPLAGDTLIRLSPSFARAYDIEVLHPHPVRAAAGAFGLELAFTPSAAGDLTVVLAGRPRRFGIVHLDIAVDARPGLSFTQIVYP